MKKRKGIILAGGSGSRLFPLTVAVSKQLMPIYDKPMIYYPLSVLMLSNIKEVLIISTPSDLPLFRKLLQGGSQFGMSFSYAEQPRPEGLAQAPLTAQYFDDGGPSAVIVCDILCWWHALAKTLHPADARQIGATIGGYPVSHPGDYGVVEIAESGEALSIEEKPARPRSPFAVPGIYFYDEQAPEMAGQLKPSARGELEITDLNRAYLEKKQLHVELLGRGTAWLDTGTHDSLLDASNFVQVIERRQGMKISCPEEIAYRKGWIDAPTLRRSIESWGSSPYRNYLEKIMS